MRRSIQQEVGHIGSKFRVFPSEKISDIWVCRERTPQAK